MHFNLLHYVREQPHVKHLSVAGRSYQSIKKKKLWFRFAYANNNSLNTNVMFKKGQEWAQIKFDHFMVIMSVNNPLVFILLLLFTKLAIVANQPCDVTRGGTARRRHPCSKSFLIKVEITLLNNVNFTDSFTSTLKLIWVWLIKGCIGMSIILGFGQDLSFHTVHFWHVVILSATRGIKLKCWLVSLVLQDSLL